MRVSVINYMNFITDFYCNKVNLRLGQAFCNRFAITDDVLFYLSDETSSRLHIIDNYVVTNKEYSMGIYVEVPRNQNKADQLRQMGAVLVPPTTKVSDIPDDKVLVCVVQNGPFDAAAVVLDEKEWKHWQNTEDDPRPRTWLMVDIKLATKLSRRDLCQLKKSSQ